MDEKKVALSAGELAPSFVLPGRFGHLVSLAEFRGRKNVLVYFYPKDDTPGCTKEACSLRDGWKELRARDVEILGISRDSLVSHDAFATKYNLPFELLSDPDQTVHGAYGAWGESKWGVGPLRKSFLVGKDGRILRIFDKVNTEHHAEEVLKAMESSIPPGAPQPPAPEPKPAAPAPAPAVPAPAAAAPAPKPAAPAPKPAAKKAAPVKKAAPKKKAAKKAAPAKKAARKAAPKRRPAKKSARKAARKPARKARKTAKRKKK
jgi:peroxiredoxin Q/BCP